MQKNSRDVIELARRLEKNFSDRIADVNFLDLARETKRISRIHHKLCENDCNRSLTESELESLRRYEIKLRKIYNPFCKISFSYDPRGYTVHIHLPNKEYNTWGGSEYGWGV